MSFLTYTLFWDSFSLSSLESAEDKKKKPKSESGHRPQVQSLEHIYVKELEELYQTQDQKQKQRDASPYSDNIVKISKKTTYSDNEI